jgi:hypothetical protein
MQLDRGITERCGELFNVSRDDERCDLFERDAVSFAPLTESTDGVGVDLAGTGIANVSCKEFEEPSLGVLPCISNQRRQLLRRNRQ